MRTFASGDLMSKSCHPEPRLQVKPSTSSPALVRLSRCCKALSLLLLSSSDTRRGETPESPRCRIPTPSRSLSPPPRCLLPIKPNAWVIPNKSHSVTSATCWCSSLTSGVWPFLATDGNAGERKDWRLQKKKKNFWPPLTDQFELRSRLCEEKSVWSNSAGCCVGSKENLFPGLFWMADLFPQRACIDPQKLQQRPPPRMLSGCGAK